MKTTALKTAAISIVLLVCAAAFCPSCVLYRAVAYGSEDIYDYRVFPQDTVRRSSRWTLLSGMRTGMWILP